MCIPPKCAPLPNVYHKNVHPVRMYIRRIYIMVHSMYISMYIPFCTFLLCYYVHFREKCLLIHSRTVGGRSRQRRSTCNKPLTATPRQLCGGMGQFEAFDSDKEAPQHALEIASKPGVYLFPPRVAPSILLRH